MDLAGKTVLLTGASGGIGPAIARALRSRGATLLLTGRRADVLAPLAAESGGTAIACDLADRAQLDRLIAHVGAVDVLVANAGLPASGALGEYTREQVDRALDVNLRAPIVLAKALSAGMVERGSGHLVFVNSLSGKSASARASLYNATKFGLRGFALALREDLRDHGVGVSTVYPGFVSDAGMFADAGVRLPRAVALRTPAQVADGVVSAIERNRAEVDVAPLALRAGAIFASAFPAVNAAVQRRFGGLEITEELATGQRSKR